MNFCLLVENDKTIFVALHYKQRRGERILLCPACVQSWVLTVAVFGSAALLAGPDATDLFPRQ